MCSAIPLIKRSKIIRFEIEELLEQGIVTGNMTHPKAFS